MAALAALSLGLMNCTPNTNSEQDANYIGPSEIQITDGVMTPEVLLSFGRLSDPQLSPDGSKILYGVSYIDIDQNRSCRNLYICNVDGSEKVQLTKDGKSISNARWSNDGKEIFFLQGGQIYKAAFEGTTLGKRTKLSNVENGVSEFKLSPDQSQLYFISTIPGQVKTAQDSDPKLAKAQAYVTEDLMYRHWDHWVTEIPHTYVASLKEEITVQNSVDILGGPDVMFELPTEPFGGAEQLDWAPDGRTIAYACRKKVGLEYAFSTNTEIYLYDTVTGKTSQVTTNGGYDTDPVWSPDGKHLAWVSMERDGYEADKQRLFVADAVVASDGVCSLENVREVNKDFKYDVAGPVWNPNSSELFFNALSNGTQKIYSMSLDGTFRQITGDEIKFDFSSPFALADDAQTLLCTYTSLNQPSEMVKVSANGEFVQLSNENEFILSQLDEPTCESVWLETVDHKQMQCWVMYPPKFDATKQYPAVEIVLGGPQGTNSQGFSYRWNYRLMAQQGYIVIMPNRRGTTAFGQEWKEQISGDYSGLNMQDYLVAGRYIKSQSYVSKLACCGASYGGYSAYYLEGIHGDLYDCFVAHAGIFDENAMWFTTEEMWFANWDNGGLKEFAHTAGKMGPQGDGITFGGLQQAGAPYAKGVAKTAHHYSIGSPDKLVTNWHTPILCIHGMMDFRIPYEQGMAAFNAAQMMGVPSKLVVFPEENHWILQPQNSLFWHREVYDWLDKWLK